MKNSGSALVFLLVAVGLLAVPPAAKATIWAEVGDAAELPGTAQITGGAGSLDAITGSLPSGSDMFAIFITDPSTFSATTVGTPGSLFDTQLFLFDSLGFGVYANDDTPSVSLRSTLPAGLLIGHQRPVSTIWPSRRSTTTLSAREG